MEDLEHRRKQAALHEQDDEYEFHLQHFYFAKIDREGKTNN